METWTLLVYDTGENNHFVYDVYTTEELAKKDATLLEETEDEYLMTLDVVSITSHTLKKA